jgi:hypothetical protein
MRHIWQYEVLPESKKNELVEAISALPLLNIFLFILMLLPSNQMSRVGSSLRILQWNVDMKDIEIMVNALTLQRVTTLVSVCTHTV